MVKHKTVQSFSLFLLIGSYNSQCETPEQRNDFLQEQLQAFNPAVSFLNALKEEDPLIVKYFDEYTGVLHQHHPVLMITIITIPQIIQNPLHCVYQNKMLILN